MLLAGEVNTSAHAVGRARREGTSFPLSERVLRVLVVPSLFTVTMPHECVKPHVLQCNCALNDTKAQKEHFARDR